MGCTIVGLSLCSATLLVRRGPTNMRKKYLIVASLLILLLLLAMRKESDSSLRFIKKQSELTKPQSGSATS